MVRIVQGIALRVAVISSWKADCGIATYSGDLSMALIGSGHEVTVLAEVGQRDEAPAVPYEPLWNRAVPSSLSAIVDHLRAHPVDIVHVQHEFGLFPCTVDLLALIRAVRDIGPKVVITLHTVKPGDDCGRSLSRAADACIVHSVGGMDALGRSPTDTGRVVHIPHGSLVIDRGRPTIAREVLGFGPEDFVVVSVGYLSPNKRLDATGAAILKALPWCRTLRWLCGGSPVNPAYADEMARWIDARQNLRTRTTFYQRYLPFTELADIFAAADICILNGPETFFSASGQLHLAASHGVAILAADTAVYHEAKVCGEVFPRDRHDLHERIVRLYKNPSERRRLAKRALRYAHQTAWPRVAGWHEMLYRQTLSATPEEVEATDEFGATLVVPPPPPPVGYETSATGSRHGNAEATL